MHVQNLLRKVAVLVLALAIGLGVPVSQFAPGGLATAAELASSATLDPGRATGQSAEDMNDATSGRSLVRSVENAPVIPDGTVAGARTEFVINLDVSPDPNVPGFALPAGKSIRVTLPSAFVNTQELPLASVGSQEDCVPGNFQCTTAALLQGWPQRPIPFGQYALSYDGANTIVITANEDILPQTPNAPGVKQIHLLWLAATNPEEGLYPVHVEIEGTSEGEWLSGYGLLEILPSTRPTVAVTSVFNPGNPNTVYQHARAGTPVPLPYDLLLWDADGNPMNGVTLQKIDASRWLLMQGDQAVGMAAIEAPAGATGQRLIPAGESFQINAPISAAPTARLRTYFQVGSTPGTYTVRFHMRGGNEVHMTVIADSSMVETVPMMRLPIDMEMPGGNSLEADCQEGAQDYPYEPYDWPNASAHLTLDQSRTGSSVLIELSQARPNTYYTIWLRLRGMDADGNAFGGSPLTGIAGSPLIPSSALGDALMNTGPGNGSADEPNGFFTDEMGNGVFKTELDFPIVNGAYPFHRFEGFDPSDERFPLEEPKIHPVAIVGPSGPFTLRLVSHCTDNTGHGLLPGPHEGWFDWKFE